MQGPHDRTFWRRAGITLGVLIAYYVGMHVPLPGLDAKIVGQLAQASGSGAVGRISVLSLGIMPLLNVLILAEILKLILPRVRQWEMASLRHRDRLNLIVVCCALAMALIQAGGLTSALEDVSGLVIDPGRDFRFVAIFTLIGGAALAITFATIIDRAGLGCGLWLLFLAPALIDLPSTLAGMTLLTWRGDYSADLIVLALAYSAVAVAGVVSIVMAARAAQPTVTTCVWTPLLVNSALVPVLFMATWLGTMDVDEAVNFATSASPFWYLALVLSVWLTVWLYARSFAQAGEASPIPVAPVAGTLAAILVAAPILEAYLGVLLPLGSTQLIVAAAVAATLIMRWRSREISADPVGEPAEAADNP